MSDSASPDVLSDGETGWREDDSARFIDLGRILTPRREEIGRTLLDLLPAETEEAFVAVEIGCGDGWLSEALLGRFPRARVLALDGSPAMLRRAAERLAPLADRVELRRFRLDATGWIDAVPAGVRCFLSSLVIHHLDGAAKQALFARLLDRLAPGGALLIADVVEPTGEWARRHMAATWDEAVRRQALAIAGDVSAYDFFVDERWNLFDHPDPDVDKPSPLADQLRWLAEAGYVGIEAPWALAGHAVFGGYKPRRRGRAG